MDIYSNNNSEVVSWLEVALTKENIKNLSVKITGGSEKGDGFIGDVLFVTAIGTDKIGSNKEYNLVLKCSKASAALLEKAPVMKETFVRESYVYENIFPAFRQFQLKREITKPFNSVPTCYGLYNDENRHVIVLENLKKIGYSLWDRKLPLTRSHINLVIGEYAKFHAISVAMQELEPETYYPLAEAIAEDMIQIFQESSDVLAALENVVQEIYDIIKDSVSERTSTKWLGLKDIVRYIHNEMTLSDDDLQVITHGDCWNNNFMYKYAEEEKSLVAKVAILDWQITSVTTPIKDLSYFLFACLSEGDLADMNTILKEYYDVFIDHLKLLGSNFGSRYPFEKFLQEWKKFSKFGLIWCLIPLKLSYTERSKVPDLAENADSGKDFLEAFEFDLTYGNDFKKRVLPIVKYAVKNDLTELVKK